jgi:alpha-beta hydrolase superfamily lysophospholipase
MLTTQEIHFQSDNYRLAATLHLPDCDRPPVVIGCHGLMADRQSPKQLALAQACARKGIAYLRFDHRGCGESQGRFENVTSLAGRCRDLYHAIQIVQTHPRLGPLKGLFGSSFGGTVVVAYAAEIPVPTVATFAAPIRSETVIADALEDYGLARDRMLQLNLRFDIRNAAGRIANILVAHGQADDLVPVAQARELYKLAGEPKKLLIQPGGDHRMSNPDHQRAFADAFISWLDAGVSSDSNVPH